MRKMTKVDFLLKLALTRIKAPFCAQADDEQARA
jgi:hypothetical protein